MTTTSKAVHVHMVDRTAYARVPATATHGAQAGIHQRSHHFRKHLSSTSILCQVRLINTPRAQYPQPALTFRSPQPALTFRSPQPVHTFRPLRPLSRFEKMTMTSSEVQCVPRKHDITEIVDSASMTELWKFLSTYM